MKAAKKSWDTLCLELFHGRVSPDRNLNDWGLQGPVLGPFQWCHVTYLTTLRILFSNDNEIMIPFAGDLIYHKGVFYGDWCVFHISEFGKKTGPAGRGKVSPLVESDFECPGLVRYRCSNCKYTERHVVQDHKYECPACCSLHTMWILPVRAKPRR